MPHRPDMAARILRQAHAAWIVAKKDAVVYYLKPPVINFGIILPLFFYLAFAAGRAMPVEAMVPGIVAIALFFTASAISPLVTPWERQARTYERLVTSPASLGAILAGDTLAGAAFGTILALVPLTVGLVATAARIADPASLILGIAFGAAAFATLGVLMAAPASQAPAQVMMLSNLVRLPLMFISGVFVPHAAMPGWGQWLAPLSPLSYAADLIRLGFGEPGHFGARIDVTALAAFTLAFLLLASLFHSRARQSAR